MVAARVPLPRALARALPLVFVETFGNFAAGERVRRISWLLSRERSGKAGRDDRLFSSDDTTVLVHGKWGFATTERRRRLAGTNIDYVATTCPPNTSNAERAQTVMIPLDSASISSISS